MTWGIPWSEGELQRNDPISLTGEAGGEVPLQTWPTAYWPDGSVKWSAHAESITGEPSSFYYFSKGKPSLTPDTSLQVSVTDHGDWIEIDTGIIRCELNKEGSSVIRSIFRGNSHVCSDGRLRCILEEQHDDSGRRSTIEHDYVSNINKVIMEQS